MRLCMWVKGLFRTAPCTCLINTAHHKSRALCIQANLPGSALKVMQGSLSAPGSLGWARMPPKGRMEDSPHWKGLGSRAVRHV